MWKTKGILFNFAVSDLKIRYRNSILGVLWSFVEPLLLLTVLFVVFSTMFKFEIPNFPIYLLLGIVCYRFFQNGTTLALSSITNRSATITQIYFPRSIPGLSAGITAAIMLVCELAVLGIFMASFLFIPPITFLLLPLVLVLELLLVFGIALPLSVLNVKFKDTEFIWGVVVSAGFFLTPIFYQFDMLPEMIRNVYSSLPWYRL